MGLAAMIGIGLASMFWPASPGLYNVWMYGGLMLFSAFILYDTQKVIYNARLKTFWDPINESLAIYLDAVIIFQRFLMIFMGRDRKK